MKKAKDIGPRPAHKKDEERPYRKVRAQSERRLIRRKYRGRGRRRTAAALASVPVSPWIWSNA